jgi:aminoglycoside phosphotransferase (APT) family kinase protein
VAGVSAEPTLPPMLSDAELRRAPSRGALATMAAAVQPGSQVGTARRLKGGISCGMHLVELLKTDGAQRRVVVRRYGSWRLSHYPEAAQQEWAVLAALERVGAPTPRPIWLDVEGSVFGCPTIVTSRVPGRGLLAPRDLDGWVRQLARALGQIHATPLQADELALLVDQRAELDRVLGGEPPADVIKQPLGAEVWAALCAWWPRIEPTEPSIVHGDFWPGNMLWYRGRLSGVIDWEQVRRGDPTQDVACCRLDLSLLFGPAAAEQFLTEYLAATGRTPRRLFFWELYNATWAIENVEHWIEGYHDLGRTDLTASEARARLERFVATALREAASIQA